jgi:uncharacterized membrane-anchored protein YhcB (DUF1043 family)
MIFALGLVVGFVIGVVLVTLAYAPLGNRIVRLEQKLAREIDLRNEAIEAIRAYESENYMLRSEIRQDEYIRLLKANGHGQIYRSHHEQ